MPASEAHEEFIHCSCQNVFVLVWLALQKSCGVCFQDGKILGIPKPHQTITKLHAGIHKVPFCRSTAASPLLVLTPH